MKTHTLWFHWSFLNGQLSILFFLTLNKNSFLKRCSHNRKWHCEMNLWLLVKYVHDGDCTYSVCWQSTLPRELTSVMLVSPTVYSKHIFLPFTPISSSLCKPCMLHCWFHTKFGHLNCWCVQAFKHNAPLHITTNRLIYFLSSESNILEMIKLIEWTLIAVKIYVSMPMTFSSVNSFN